MSTDDKQFFPMRRSQGWTLLVLVVFSVFAFLPAWRTEVLGGMVVFGWLMALLMVASPTLALLIFVLDKRASRRRVDSP